MNKKLTHFDESGNARMVDVSEKSDTKRVAIATGRISVGNEIIEHITNKSIEKGDVLGVATVAGIMAAKNTSTAIPMCHPLMITGVDMNFEIDADAGCIIARAEVKTTGQTGVEMEALHACSVALLTIYDMCKAIDKSMVISDIRLEHKSGGKSGDYNR